MSIHLDNEPDSTAWNLFCFAVLLVLLIGAIVLLTRNANGEEAFTAMTNAVPVRSIRMAPMAATAPTAPVGTPLYIVRTNNTYTLSWMASNSTAYTLRFKPDMPSTETMMMQTNHTGASSMMSFSQVVTATCGFWSLMASNLATSSDPWVHTFGASNASVIGIAAVVGVDNNIISAAQFSGASVSFGGGFLTNAGGRDLALAKHSRSGTHLWSKRAGGSGDEFVKGLSVDTNGNVIICGSFTGSTDLGAGPTNSAGQGDMFIGKYSSDGSYVWSKTFGGAYTDSANGVTTDADGNIYLAGSFSDAVDFGSGIMYAAYGGTDSFLAKFSPSGSNIWSKRFETFAADYAQGVAVDTNGAPIVIGYFLGTQIDCGGGWLTNHGGSDAYVAKYAPDGSHLFSKNFGGSTADQAVGVTTDRSNNVYVLGWFSNSGEFAGTNLTTAGGWDGFIIKLSPNGTRQWVRSFPSNGSGDFPRGLACGSDLSVTVVGEFTLPIDCGGGLMQPSANGIVTGFAAKYSSAGAHLWSKRIAASSTLDCNSVGQRMAKTVLTGYFQGTADFDGQTSVSAGPQSTFLQQLDQ